MSLGVGLAPALHPGRVILYDWMNGESVEVGVLSPEQAKVMSRMLLVVVEIIESSAILPQTAEGVSP